jgi:hypothetical protein
MNGPGQVSNLGIRLVGYSTSAGFVTVIAYREMGRLYGVTAYKASGSDFRAYQEESRE